MKQKADRKNVVGEFLVAPVILCDLFSPSWTWLGVPAWVYLCIALILAVMTGYEEAVDRIKDTATWLLKKNNHLKPAPEFLKTELARMKQAMDCELNITVMVTDAKTIGGILGSVRAVLDDSVILINEAMLQVEDREQLYNLLAHELGHVIRDHASLYRCFAFFNVLISTAIYWLSLYAMPTTGLVQWGGSVIIAIAIGGSAYFLLRLMWQFGRRRLELEADATGAEIRGVNNMIAYQRWKASKPEALRGISKHRRQWWFERLIPTHPSIADRVAALEALQTTAPGGFKGR